MSCVRVGMSETRGRKYSAALPYPAVAYAVTRGRDLAFFFVSLKASLRAVPAGIRAIWLYTWFNDEKVNFGRTCKKQSLYTLRHPLSLLHRPLRHPRFLQCLQSHPPCLS